jgi:hypothetical protein
MKRQTATQELVNRLAEAVTALEEAAQIDTAVGYDEQGIMSALMDAKTVYARACDILNSHAENRAA